MEENEYVLEQLVSFETAKLAKEKGLTYREIGLSYRPNGEITYGKNDDVFYPAPTQAQFQKWLRVKHNIFVYAKSGYTQEIKNDKLIYSFKPSIEVIEIIGDNLFHSELKYEMFLNLEPMSYEDALEIGLQEALKLI